jgi:iron complex transport system substrate-binding protein
VSARSRLNLLLAFGTVFAACQPVPVDDEPAATENAAPADLRIVSLAPHLAELVFAVGAGDLLVGVTAYTDYPEAAAALPHVGDAFAIDQEQLEVLKPDVLLAWQSGTPAHIVDELRKRGFRVETIETRGIEDVAVALERLGRLTGHEAEASEAAAAFRGGLEALAERYQGSQPLTVFYQVSSRPLYTINGDHYVSELISVCGGHNIFADLGSLAPLVDVEAVLTRDPEVMLGSDDSESGAFDVWRRWPDLAANRYGNYFLLPANEIGRATPRLLDAGRKLCETLEVARESRDKAVAL